MKPIFQPRGFSLIETLVSVAIVGILAAVIVPAVSGARDRANTAACASNLRQIGVAMLAYAGDHDNRLPLPLDLEKPWPFSGWKAEIAPYAQITIPTDNFQAQMAGVFSGIFRCPGKKDWRLNGQGVTDQNRNSYGMNSFNTQNNIGEVRKLTAIAQPAKTMLVADVGMAHIVVANSDYMYSGSPALRHQKADNVLFCDGHVEAVKKGGLSYDLVLTL